MIHHSGYCGYSFLASNLPMIRPYKAHGHEASHKEEYQEPKYPLSNHSFSKILSQGPYINMFHKMFFGLRKRNM